MTGRAPDEQGRTATRLELFFDLVFVVAIASAAAALHHDLAEGIVSESIVRYAQVFFAIWWAWMNFTWFASAYDTDDGPYRLTIFVGITGSLLLAAGVPAAFQGDFAVVTIGYVIMRLGLVSLWLRAGREDPDHRRTTHRYALGVAVAQIGWVLLLFIPQDLVGVGFLFLVIVELTVPIWAESASVTTWHREHIEERYGLFTIIVLGESILASSFALQAVLSEDTGLTLDVVLVFFGGLLIVFSMWWLYFASPRHDLLSSVRRVFVWGYGHYFVWAAAAAVGAGLAVNIDHVTAHAQIGAFGAGASAAVPAALYLVTLWVLNYLPRKDGSRMGALTLVAAALILLTPLTGQAVLLTGLILAGLLATKLVSAHR